MEGGKEVVDHRSREWSGGPLADKEIDDAVSQDGGDMA